MNAILTVLSDWHKYRFLRLDPALAKFYQGKRMAKVINKIKQKVKKQNIETDFTVTKSMC